MGAVVFCLRVNTSRKEYLTTVHTDGNIAGIVTHIPVEGIVDPFVDFLITRRRRRR